MSDTQRELRGHDFLPQAHLDLPPLYETEETPTPDKVVHLHYFIGSMDWWIIEYDPTDGTAFCHTRDRDGHAWGYVNLPELERVRIPPGAVVERDQHWVPQTAAEARLTPETTNEHTTGA